ncbi:MAG: hypothetical protein ABIC57_03575 [bacterium]
MKIDNRFKKLYVLISFLPIVPMVFMSQQNSFLDINAVSSNVVMNFILTISIFYVFNLVYKFIYNNDEEKKLISPLAFVFISNMIHNFAFFVGSLPIYLLITDQLSSSMGLSFVLASFVIIIENLVFERKSHNINSSLPLFQILKESDRESLTSDIFFSFTPIVVFSMIGLLDFNILKDYGLFGLLLLWNLLFTQIVRPQLFTFLDNE